MIFGENVSHMVMKFAKQANENLRAVGTTLIGLHSFPAILILRKRYRSDE
jgi:hypothetical protein